MLTAIFQLRHTKGQKSKRVIKKSYVSRQYLNVQNWFAKEHRVAILKREDVFCHQKKISKNDIFFNTQICFLAYEDGNINSTFLTSKSVDDDDSRSWMQKHNEMSKPLLRNHSCSHLFLYC